MEIALLPKSALRIKGKSASFVVNPQEPTATNAALLLDDTIEDVLTDEAVTIQGPGEYEIGGVKITGTRGEKGIVYSLQVDGIDVLVGKMSTLSAMQHKLKEHNLVISECNESGDGAFLTSLATSSLVYYGEKAQEVTQGFESESLKKMNKYVLSPGKLPTEVETVLLT